MDRNTRSRFVGIVLLVVGVPAWFFSATDDDRPYQLPPTAFRSSPQEAPARTGAVEAAGGTLTMTLRASDLFDGDDVHLAPGATAALAEVRSAIGDHPGARVVIVARAGPEGARSEGADRTERRAQAVRTHLVEVGGVSPFLVTAYGEGLTHPDGDPYGPPEARIEVTLDGVP
jgi:outer membrane protein OmpA-like peptidoglycan-associated protein